MSEERNRKRNDRRVRTAVEVLEAGIAAEREYYLRRDELLRECGYSEASPSIPVWMQ